MLKCFTKNFCGFCPKQNAALLSTVCPDQTRPDQTRPDQTRPDQTRPDQTRPESNLAELILELAFLFTPEKGFVNFVLADDNEYSDGDDYNDDDDNDVNGGGEEEEGGWR